LPRIDKNVDFTGFIESYSLIFIKDLLDNSLTIDYSDFEDNISLTSNLWVENAGSISITNTRFKK